MIEWDALYKVSLGLYVLGANDASRPVGSIVDAVMIAANKPCALALSCGNASYTKSCIEQNHKFSLSVLPKDIEPFVVANFGFQSSKNINKWDNVKYDLLNGLPVLQNALAQITAKVLTSYPLESNTVFIAEIEEAKNIRNAENLLYEDYRNYFKNDVIKNAPTYLPEEDAPAGKEVWKCSVCGYVYDGETPFEELPDDWACPVCGVDKSFFEQRDAE